VFLFQRLFLHYDNVFSVDLWSNDNAPTRIATSWGCRRPRNPDNYCAHPRAGRKFTSRWENLQSRKKSTRGFVSLATNVKKINFNLITIWCWNRNTHSSLKNYRSNLFFINFILWLTMSKYVKLDHLGYWKPETKPDMQIF